MEKRCALLMNAKIEDITQVDTKITDNKGQDYSVNYRLRDVNGDWKVLMWLLRT